MHELTITKQNGVAYIDSRDVADYIGKRHDHLLRDINGYRKILGKVVDPTFGVNNFFVEYSYHDKIGRTLPCYLITKMGAELCANRISGEKGILFAAAYIKKFHDLEAREREEEIKSHARPRLSEFNGAVRNVLSGMSYNRAKPNSVIDFLKGVYEPLGIKVNASDDGKEYLSATNIARLLKVYSETGRPHGHAVAAIITKLDNWWKHAIAVPYGVVGVSIRYGGSIVEMTRKWLSDNNMPNKVPYHDFCYHIYYNRQLSMYDEYATSLDEFEPYLD